MSEQQDSNVEPEHWLNGMGICRLDCPACAINRHKNLVMREKMGYGPEPVEPSPEEHTWLHYQHVSWFGDKR